MVKGNNKRPYSPPIPQVDPVEKAKERITKHRARRRLEILERKVQLLKTQVDER